MTGGALLAHISPSSPVGAVLTWVGLACCVAAAARFAGVAARRVPEKAAIVLVVAGIAAVVGGAVIGDGAPAAATRPVATGSVRIVAPAKDTALSAATVKLRVEVKDFTLVPVVGGPAEPNGGRGHLHVTLDGVVVGMPGDATTVDVCVPRGRHSLTVLLVAEDHYGFANERDVTDSVEVTGRDDAAC